jgi:hypothetical protein
MNGTRLKGKPAARAAALALIAAITLGIAFGAFMPQRGLRARAAAGELNLIAATPAAAWVQPNEGKGTWGFDQAGGTASIDARLGSYAMDGAVAVSDRGTPLGAFEMSANIKITDFDNTTAQDGAGSAGFIPWYIDKDNYLFVQMYFTYLDTKYDGTGLYIKSPEEIAQHCAIERITVTGVLNGEDKFKSATEKEGSTSFFSSAAGNLQTYKKDVKNAAGHNLKVKLENVGSAATFYRVSIYYENQLVGTTDIYNYVAHAKPQGAGLIAWNVRGSFSQAVINDYDATHATSALARDWVERNGFVYRVLNGKDMWTFGEGGSVSADTTKTADNKSEYKVSGTNFAGYNTNRGFTVNPVATSGGLPQNYAVQATFKADEIPARSGSTELKFGYGMIPWYQDDFNYVDVTFRKTVSGPAATPTVKNELVLFGWIGGSSMAVGSNNIYELPEDFDMTASHTLRVEKKSIEFLVYLDGGAEPVLTKRVQGAGENYYYGYAGYGVKYTAGALSSEGVYVAYDEISVYDSDGAVRKAIGKSKTAWGFDGGSVTLAAKETGATLSKLSSLVGPSDVFSPNLTVNAVVSVAPGAGAQQTILMLSPYLFDENNYVRIGLVWRDGKTFARIRASVLSEEDAEEDKEPTVILKETEIASISTAAPLHISVEKILDTVTLAVGGSIVYGKRIPGIAAGRTAEYGVYAYNADLNLTTLETVGYKKYEKIQVGDWTTSGVSQYAWILDENGNLIGDNTYAPNAPVDENDECKIYAIKNNPVGLYEDYTITVKVRVLEESRAQDRVGIVAWYVDDNNFLMYMMDRWRGDSNVPRTTFFGKIDGKWLPNRYTHGAWLPNANATQIADNQVQNFHTVTVSKTGNNFSCTIDGNKGGLNMTGVAVPALQAGQVVKTGMYLLNDRAEYTEYGVYENGAERTVTAPGTPSQATDLSGAQEPTLPAFAETDYIDEFDGGAGSGELPDDGDQIAADAVTAKINALPASVTLADKQKVTEARGAYDALTAAQKGKVSSVTLKKLTDAESAIKALEDETPPDEKGCAKGCGTLGAGLGGFGGGLTIGLAAVTTLAAFVFLSRRKTRKTEKKEEKARTFLTQ